MRPIVRLTLLLSAFLFAFAAAPTLASADDAPIVTAQADGSININTASATELTQLKGIGKKKAQAIVDYRTANGAFASVDDLTKVKGIGKKTVEKLRAQITVGDGEAVVTTGGGDTLVDAGDTTVAVTGDTVAIDAGGTQVDVAGGTTAVNVGGGGGININTATAAELTALPGIGKGKAAKIVEYRNTNGPFASVDDLTKVKGIGKKTVEKFRDQVTVGE